jgi:hypothetical protein
MRRSSSRPLLGGGAEGRSLLHLSRVSLCHSLPTAARRANSWFKRSQPKTCLKTPTPTSWFAVPCASTSIASIRLPALFWAETISRPRRAGLAVKLSDAQASGVNSTSANVRRSICMRSRATEGSSVPNAKGKWLDQALKAIWETHRHHLLGLTSNPENRYIQLVLESSGNHRFNGWRWRWRLQFCCSIDCYSERQT